jgi:fibronectin type 3 domain-containing protein
MQKLIAKMLGTIGALSIMTLGLMLSGCGSSSGGLSSQVVSGVASVGAPLAGQVTLKDSSSTALSKTTVIGADGSFAIDVTGMQGPFILEANDTSGTGLKLHSFADGTGTANINPLTEAIVASAAGDDDASQTFNHADRDKLHKISGNLTATITALLTKLQPLLVQYNALNTNPITARYIVKSLGMDEMFDNVKITVSNGTLTILNVHSGAAIYTGKLSDIANGVFNMGSMPPVASLPAAPTGVTAVGGTGQVSLSWGSVSNATAYNVYYSTSTGVTAANGTKIASAVSPYLQTGLSAGTTYYYVVTAQNAAGESAASAQASASTTATVPVPTAPAAPTGVMATGGTKQVTLSWPAVSGATSYNIYYATSTGVTPASGTKLSGATSPAVQSNLADGTAYYYVVTAVNGVGESAPSAQVAATTMAAVPAPTAPAAPTGVSAMGGAKQVTISWPAVSGAASYNIYYSTTAGVTTTSGTKIAAASSPYVQANLSAGVTYYYVVTAVNSIGESAASTQASASTSPAAPAIPGVPSGVAATGGTNQVTVSWPAVTGATSYNLYWSTSSTVTTASGTKIASATSPYVQTGLAAGTAYYYLVTAVNASGESAASTRVTASTSAPVPVIPAAPISVVATGGANQVSLTWPAVSGATSYNIYYSTTSGVKTNTGSKISGATSPYLQTGLAAGTTYYYIVTAVNSAGESAASAQASAATSAAAPSFDALSFYNTSCLGCHGSLGVRTAAQITSAIAGVGSMSQYRSTGSNPLTAAQISAIAAVSY